MYSTCLVVGGISDSALLGVPVETLVQFGAKVPEKMRYDLEVWRFITPVFLHANFGHILSNTIMFLLVG